LQGEMSQGRNVAQGEMSLWEKCRREKSRREKCRREKCLSGRNVVQSFEIPTTNEKKKLNAVWNSNQKFREMKTQTKLISRKIF